MAPAPTAGAPPRAAALADLVFNAWLTARAAYPHRGTPPKLDAKRRRAVLARLGDGFDVNDLVRAARGIWASQWHRDNRQTDLALAMRDAAHVERFAELATPPPPVVPHCSSGAGPRIDFHGADGPRVNIADDPRFTALLARFPSPAPTPAANGGRL